MTQRFYTEEELRAEGLIFFRGDILACNVWIKKYALKINGKFVEGNPDDTIKRIASEIHRVESKNPNGMAYKEIYKNLKNFKKFIFAGSILFGLGNPNNVSLGNCFFINNGADSYGGIFQLDESMAQLMKRRGGVGITLEHLRPETALVRNSAQSSTGAISFMNRYSSTTREVAQDGRRGALMISLHVHHPDIKKFITIKNDLTKITGANISVKMTDEFMKAARDNQDFYLHWPIQDKQPEVSDQIPYDKLYEIEPNKYVKRVKAKEIWDELIKMAHKNAEPGVLFWDNIIRESPADMYSKFGFHTQGTNPCIVGSTLIATADGRGEARIDQLVKEGKDVPVYSLNKKGEVEIQMMRNPRITGYNQQIYKVNLDSGDSVRVTGNHKFRLKDGTYKEAKDLKCGDSLYVSYYGYSPIVSNKTKHHKKDYRWINGSGGGKGKSEHVLIYEFYHNLKIPKGYVIHHKDYDTLNNSISNLQMMSKKDHDYLHSKDMLGNKNPYHRMSDEWKYSFACHPSESNGMCSGISNYKLYREIINETSKRGRRLSKREWKDHATYLNKNNDKNRNMMPLILHSEFRGGNSIYLLERAAVYLGLEHIDKDPRLVRTYKKALGNGYEAKIDDYKVMVKGECKECGDFFWQEYSRREISFCSHTCANVYLNSNTDVNERRSATINKTYAGKAEITKENQLRIYSQTKFDLRREPLIAEWKEACQKESVPCRIGTKNGFSKWSDVKKLGAEYNHKVVSVEEDGFETVYNGTVDNNHNFSIILNSIDKLQEKRQFFCNTKNCGEVPLSPFDSCRLGSINIFSLVKKPFTPDAKMNWPELASMARFAQRVMDDIIILEEEKVLGIIEKLKNDPEPESVKRTEIMVWKNVLDVLKKGRRTGVGLLGLGDAMAALGIKYGSKEGTKFAEEVMKTIAVNSYMESINLAKERGHFPIWNADLEAMNPYLMRVISNNFDNKEYDDYLNYGRRNIANLSIAPTGSLAILSQTTSSMEPVFKVYYRRRRKVNPGEEGVKITFVDQNGDSWEEYNVIHYPFVDWYHQKFSDDMGTFEGSMEYLKNLDEESLDQIVAESPWGGSEAHTIDYLEKIDMQGKIQKWVDHSISVTHNLPEDITVEETNKIYFKGWESGCKGLTIYRDGSRSGVLLSKKDSVEDDFIDSRAPKRPRVLEADYYAATSKGVQYAVIIGLYKDKPYEVWAFENPPIYKNTRGKVIKIKQGHYKFVNGDFEIDSLELAGDKELERAVTLMASGLLRHGTPIPYVIKTIKKIDENISSFSSVVRRYLSRYENETHEVNGESCPDCGEKLINEAGCVSCVNEECGYSKCGG
jgi:ribonucleotide reductase alpha subunit